LLTFSIHKVILTCLGGRFSPDTVYMYFNAKHTTRSDNGNNNRKMTTV